MQSICSTSWLFVEASEIVCSGIQYCLFYSSRFFLFYFILFISLIVLLYYLYYLLYFYFYSCIYLLYIFIHLFIYYLFIFLIKSIITITAKEMEKYLCVYVFVLCICCVIVYTIYFSFV